MKKELVSQYQASLKMLINVVTQCPDQYWNNATYKSPYWQVVYHSLHFTNFYLSDNQATFTPWADHRPGIHQLGALEKSLVGDNLKAYSKEELHNYAKQISDQVEAKLDDQNLKDMSGFDWLRMNKFELHLYNLRHLQHHIGQLVEQLHSIGIQTNWIITID